MQFQQNANVPRLYAAVDNGDAPAGTLLYLLPPNSPAPPTTLALAVSWQQFSGVYLFLAEPLEPGQEQAFVNAAQQFLADPRMQGARFVWFYPSDGSSLLSGQAILLSTATGDGTTTAQADFVWRNLTLTLLAGAAVTLDVANAVFRFTAAGPQALFLTTVSAANPLYSQGPQLALPLSGALAGSLQFTLPLQFDLANGVDNLADLDVGLRYFYAEPFDQTAAPGAGNDGFFLGTLRYPIFNQSLLLYANLDPLAALAPARTFFAFNETDTDQVAGQVAKESAGTAPALATYFRSTLGDAFNLLPQTGNAAPTGFAALVLAVNQGASTSAPDDPYYLVPRGDFQIVPTNSNAHEMMCGLSGVEYLALDAAQNLLSFFPGHAAFAQGFVPGQPPGVTNLTPTDFPTTAFACVTAANSQLDYFAQPDQAVLYNYDANATKPLPSANQQTLTALAAVQVHAATLNWPPTTAPVFPLLPYAGLSGQDLGPYQQLESQIINPARRSILKQAPPQARALTATLASLFSTTPQGLLADYANGEIILAQMNLPQPTPAQLRLENVTGELLSAFQSNKMFLVVSDHNKLADVLQPQFDQIILGLDPQAAWQFDLDPAQWAANGTVMLIKFYDLSITDLLGQTSAWASGDYFNNGSAAQAAQTIQAFISQADAGDADFAAFLNAVNNPNWNGILFLNVRAPLNNLPSELAGLAVGIDQSRFRAHHVGINASKINAPAIPGEITIAPSSIFGLIHYQAQSALQPNQGDYQFQVEQLKVLFLNSAVASFSSVIDLQINTLFGEAATLEGATDNVVRLYGVYQKHVVNGQTQESYLFQTQSGQAATFNLKSQVLNAVQLSKGQFFTVTSQDTTSQTKTQFVFWGLLDFQALTGLDLFSFGREADATTPAGLNFSKLVIEMDFNPSASPPTPQFTFDASQLAFDLAASTARAGSLYQHFPLTVAGFTQAKEGTKPTDLGFMGVQSPLTQSALQYPWFSLNFNLNLGSPGALAAQAGFIATLTAAWQPQTGQSASNYMVFTGLKLPGSSGAKREISLEGLFSVTFKTLELIAAPASNTFILVLYNIAFKFFKFTIPPSGQVNFVLFGDPQNPSGGGNSSLGWYAAYAKPDSGKSGGSSKAGLLARPGAPLLKQQN